MKRLTVWILAVLLLLPICGCRSNEAAQVAATTLPVYEFTLRLCRGTDISVSRLVTEDVSCLHDYTLQVGQMRTLEGARVVVQSGAGLEAVLDDAIHSAQTVIDASEGLSLHGSEHDHDHGHVHPEDPHIWLSPANARVMAENICRGLMEHFPQHAQIFSDNLTVLIQELDALQAYGEEALAGLSCRELITFHDGFAYFAEAFDLTILKAVEEESGSEASAAELIEIISLVDSHGVPAIFTETNGSAAAAQIIAEETGARLYSLDMAMAGESYFEAMYHNIDTIREAMQ